MKRLEQGDRRSSGVKVPLWTAVGTETRRHGSCREKKTDDNSNRARMGQIRQTNSTRKKHEV